MSYRFTVGQRVLANVGSTSGGNPWAAGVVAKLDYREKDSSRKYAYQIRLENGGLMLAPEDSDDCVRVARDEGPAEASRETTAPGAVVELVGLVSAREGLNGRKAVVRRADRFDPSQFIVVVDPSESKDPGSKQGNNKKKKKKKPQVSESSRTMAVDEVNLRLLKPGAPLAARVPVTTKAELREMAK